MNYYEKQPQQQPNYGLLALGILLLFIALSLLHSGKPSVAAQPNYTSFYCTVVPGKPTIHLTYTGVSQDFLTQGEATFELTWPGVPFGAWVNGGAPTRMPNGAGIVVMDGDGVSLTGAYGQVIASFTIDAERGVCTT